VTGRFAIAYAALCAACTIGPSTASDAGTDAPPQTVGDQCSALVKEFCLQAINHCGIQITLADCTMNDMPMCCSSTTCSAVSQFPPSAVSACTSAIDAEDCNLITNSQSPAECQSLLHP
jgi:hypothetical protein